jgi:hypothetical protein
MSMVEAPTLVDPAGQAASAAQPAHATQSMPIPLTFGERWLDDPFGPALRPERARALLQGRSPDEHIRTPNPRSRP